MTNWESRSLIVLMMRNILIQQLLLGQIVLEALDLVVDCGRQRLIPDPEAPDGMMLYEDY